MLMLLQLNDLQAALTRAKPHLSGAIAPWAHPEFWKSVFLVSWILSNTNYCVFCFEKYTLLTMIQLAGLA
jgi:hypothetical protein